MIMSTTPQAAPATQLELEDIQGFVFSGYKHLPASVFVFLKINNPAQAREWLKIIVPQVRSARRWSTDGEGDTKRPKAALNLAFTAAGLELLQIPLAGFLTEFCEGIAPAPGANEEISARSRRLGDSGPSAPDKWEYGGYSHTPIHLLLLLFAPDQESLKTLLEDQRAAWERYDLTVLAQESTYLPAHHREPFGFADGLSQPDVEGLNTSGPGKADVVQAGEFVQGYSNEYNYLPPVPSAPKLARNGTYLVYRKLEQDVVGFWNFVFEAAKGDEKLAEYIAAKFVGRWRSGAPLTLRPEQDDPALAADTARNNAFQYVADHDKTGYGCPVGSHIRRTNPRDSLLPNPEASTLSVRRHRILRRGRIYGPTYPEDLLAHLLQLKNQEGGDKFVSDSAEPRGLAFICVNADLKRQFEFIQQSWVNDPKFDGLYNDKDPLLGSNEKDATSDMTIPRQPLRIQLQNLPRLVTVRAGSYFYMPGLVGLQYIAGLS